MTSNTQESALFEGLKRIEDTAIQALQRIVLPKIEYYCALYKLPKNLAEEITNDSMLVLLDAIDTGKYLFEGSSPSAYCLRVGHYLLQNLRRSKYHQLDRQEEIEQIENQWSNNEAQGIEELLHQTLLIEQLLNQMGEQCQAIIRLKYLKDFTHEQIIQQQLSVYKSVASLKNALQKCMAKLRETTKKINYN